MSVEPAADELCERVMAHPSFLAAERVEDAGSGRLEDAGSSDDDAEMSSDDDMTSDDDDDDDDDDAHGPNPLASSLAHMARSFSQ